MICSRSTVTTALGYTTGSPTPTCDGDAWHPRRPARAHDAPMSKDARLTQVGVVHLGRPPHLEILADIAQEVSWCADINGEHASFPREAALAPPPPPVWRGQLTFHGTPLLPCETTGGSRPPWSVQEPGLR